MKRNVTGIIGQCCVLACIWLAGCDRKLVLTEVLSEQMEVVEAPFPLGYPSSNPQKNRVIATLHRGDRFYFRGEEFGKDYKYFDVQLLSGEKGYVMYEGGGEPQVRRVEDKR
jgi:hypothetical protein